VIRLLALAIISQVLHAQPAPRYDSYPVARVDLKTFAPIQAPKTRDNWKLLEYLPDAEKYAVNFAGKFTVFEYSCGIGCTELCLIDRQSGNVYESIGATINIPKSYKGPYGFHYRPDSRLLVVCHAERFKFPILIDYYILEGTSLKLLQSYSQKSPGSKPVKTR
jgi:hypothetical protein